MTPDGEITTAYIAAWKGWSRITAWRYLLGLEKQHGAEVVRRRGRLLYTTRTGLARAGEDLPPATDIRTERRLKALEEAVGRGDERNNGFARDIGELRREFRKISNAWFKRATV